MPPAGAAPSEDEPEEKKETAAPSTENVDKSEEKNEDKKQIPAANEGNAGAPKEQISSEATSKMVPLWAFLLMTGAFLVAVILLILNLI